jgi:signal transduction histidine kinase
MYFYFRDATEETVRATLLEQYEQRQMSSAATLSKSIAADLNLLMTKLEVLAESGPVQSGDFASEGTNVLMKRIFEESNMIARVEGIGISNSNNIVMNVYQPEIDRNQLIGRNMSSQPYAIDARDNLPNPFFSNGYETIVNEEGQRMALLHPIHDSQGTHIGWTRSAVDASRFFERYGNIRDIETEHFFVLDRSANILVSPMADLEGKNFFESDLKTQLGYGENADELFRATLSGHVTNSLVRSSFGDKITTGYPIVIEGEPIYFMFLVTPASSIYSEIEETLFALKVQTMVLFAVSGTAISVLVIILTRMNSILRRKILERTGELESASTKLNSLNDALEVKNQELTKSNNELAEKESELQNALTKVLEIGKEKEEFSAMITHELKTPLVPIIGYGDMFLKGKLGELSLLQKQKLRIMYESAGRLVNLIQDILDAQKLELGEMHFDMRKVSAGQLIEESINSLKPQADGKGVQLINSLSSEFGLVCDPDRILQVLNNLANNGIKFSPNNGRIELGASQSDGSIVFSVKDSGIGIPKEKQSRLFTKFYQVETSLTRRPGGTGLGLVICRGIVEAHNGRIWLNSEAGKGSIFSFSLPIAGISREKENSGSG